MKNFVKKMIAVLAVLAVASTMSFGVFAEDAAQVTGETAPVSEGENPALVTGQTAPVSVPANSVVVDGNVLEASTYAKGSVVMVPIRAAAEAMGFVVGWDNGKVTLEKGAVYVTLAIGTDGYTIAKTAPMPLGQAPELVDEKTYVPSTLFSQIMEINTTVSEDGTVAFSTVEAEPEEQPEENQEEEEPEVAVNVTVKSIEVDEEYNYTAILVEDADKGEVQLNLDDESDIVLLDGTKGTREDIEVGMGLEVIYGKAMTMSIPPQNHPAKVTVTAAAPVKEPGSAVITEVKNSDVTVTDEALGTVVLHVTSKTEIVLLDGKKGKVSDLKADMNIDVEYGEEMTTSEPPQNTPVKITVVEREEEEADNKVKYDLGEVTGGDEADETEGETK